jgi:hypothetical protein
VRTTDRWRLLAALALLGPALAEAAEVALAPPIGPYTQAECVQCHATRDPALVEQWRAGPHAGTADCVACHGGRHGALAAARADAACTGCHAGAVAHSYATSKHGVLMRLGRPDWSEPLRRGRYRAPGCAYCHLHDGDHGDRMDPARDPSGALVVCGACHAPRYVTEQLAAGERLTEIARIKRREAEEIAMRHPAGSSALKSELESVNQHLANGRLGAGHQSPDYQWWHGQPALDGDLIRLRDAVAQAARGGATGRAAPAVAPGAVPSAASAGSVDTPRPGGAGPGEGSGGAPR